MTLEDYVQLDGKTADHIIDVLSRVRDIRAERDNVKMIIWEALNKACEYGKREAVDRSVALFEDLLHKKILQE